LMKGGIGWGRERMRSREVEMGRMRRGGIRFV
jgi:hypothetical protein